MTEKKTTILTKHKGLISIIVSAICSSGFTGAFFQYQIDSKRLDQETGKDYYTLIIEDNARLRKENAQLDSLIQSENKKLTTLLSDMARLENAVLNLESSHQDLPFPMWLKDSSGRMLALNAAYEELFLIPRGYTSKDYIGKLDIEIWPLEIANQFKANDLRVFRSGIVFNGFETAVDANGETYEIQVIKYVRYSGRVKIGTAGIMIPKASR